MRVSRFYTGQTLAEDTRISLDGETAHYIARVLRLGPGDALILFNGDGNEYHARLENADK
ncbi:MAG TPA: RsmE family RNA methyltransferase, partial [Gammaproteobacteria bacterium]|nr:RsmE family RNA methyltransferase [Gammaproteobacteria bacterium]